MLSKKEQILKLRQESWSYDDIAKYVNCSKSLVHYYINPKVKNQTLSRNRKRRKSIHPLKIKMERYLENHKPYSIISPQKPIIKTIVLKKYYRFFRTGDKYMFTLEQLLEKITNNPKCYLTGIPIDLSKSNTYQLDHIIPRSRGGDNSLENLGICTKEANLAKSDKTPDEFIQLCKNVLNNFGYKIK